MSLENLKNQNGFSFIEIMVIVSILGIIINLGMNRYRGLNDTAYDTEAESNINSAMKILKSLESEDSQNTNLSFEVANNAVAVDDSSFLNYYPKLRTNPTGVYFQVIKIGSNVNMVSFHCHGTKKYSYNSSVGEFIVQSTALTGSDRSDKCAN